MKTLELRGNINEVQYKIELIIRLMGKNVTVKQAVEALGKEDK